MPSNTQGRQTQQFVTRQTAYFANKVVFGDDATQISMGWVPAGSVILNARAEVKTLFNDTGSDLIDIGYGADPDEFCANLDVSAVGTKFDATTFNAAGNKVFTADTEIVCQYDGANSDASTGLAYVVVEYAFDASEIDA